MNLAKYRGKETATINTGYDLPATYRQRKLLVGLTHDGRWYDLPLTIGQAGEEIRILLTRKRTKGGQNVSSSLPQR